MNQRDLRKLQKNKNFVKLVQKQGVLKKKRHTLLILILLALIGYFIFAKGNLYLIIGLTVLLVFLMR